MRTGMKAILLALALIVLGACASPPIHDHSELSRRVDRVERELTKTQERQQQSRQDLRQLYAELEKQREMEKQRKRQWSGWGVLLKLVRLLVRR